jgi:hypothetical protein
VTRLLYRLVEAETRPRVRFVVHCVWMLTVGLAVGVIAGAETWTDRAVRGVVFVVVVTGADRRWRGEWRR